MKENEEMLIRLKIKTSIPEGGADMKALKDKNQEEYFQTLINTLRLEMYAKMKKIAASQR